MKLITNSVLREVDRALICLEDVCQFISLDGFVGIYYNDEGTSKYDLSKSYYDPEKEIILDLVDGVPVFSKMWYDDIKFPNGHITDQDTFDRAVKKWEKKYSGYIFCKGEYWEFIWLNRPNTCDGSSMLYFEDTPVDWKVENVKEIKSTSLGPLSQLELSAVISETTKENRIVKIKYMLHFGNEGTIFNHLIDAIDFIRDNNCIISRRSIFRSIKKELESEIYCRNSIVKPKVNEVAYSYHISSIQLQDLICELC